MKMSTLDSCLRSMYLLMSQNDDIVILNSITDKKKGD